MTYHNWRGTNPISMLSLLSGSSKLVFTCWALCVFSVDTFIIDCDFLCCVFEDWGNGGGGHWLVRMEWRPAGWSVCLPLLISPCTIKSRSSLLAPAHLGGPRKTAVKRLWCAAYSRRQPDTRGHFLNTVYNKLRLLPGQTDSDCRPQWHICQDQISRVNLWSNSNWQGNDGQRTRTCSIAYFQPPRSRSKFTPAVRRHERPGVETLRRRITHTSRQQRRPCSLRRRQKHFDLAATRRSQGHHRLDVLQVNNARVRRTSTAVAVQGHLQLAVNWNASEHSTINITAHVNLYYY